MQSDLRVGYVVPQFPGQTHAFFWREIDELEALGVTVDIISTTHPTGGASIHSWATEAASRTTYLGAPAARDLPGALSVLIGALMKKRARSVLAALRIDDGASLVTRMRVLIAASIMTGRARRRGWTHAHVHSCGVSAWIALVASRLGHISYSLTLHGPLSDYGAGQVAKWRGARFVLVITRALLSDVRSVLGEMPGLTVGISPMGVRLRELGRRDSYQAWRSGPLQIFSCGRLNVAKGHDNLIRATGLLAASGLDVRLTIAGEDEQGGSGYRRELERLITDLGLQERVELLGAVSQTAVRDRLERAHVFALASHAEPLGVAIMEAMAMGVPVVVGDGGGVRELVDERCGVLVDPKSVESISQAITGVLSDPERAESLGRAGIDIVRTSFSTEAGAVNLRRYILEAEAISPSEVR